MARKARIKDSTGKRSYVSPSGLMAAGVSESAIRRGVVPGAEPEQCPVCKTPSEGWHIEGGKRTWYHFRRIANCAERYAHMPSVSE